MKFIHSYYKCTAIQLCSAFLFFILSPAAMVSAAGGDPSPCEAADACPPSTACVTQTCSVSDQDPAVAICTPSATLVCPANNQCRDYQCTASPSDPTQPVCAYLEKITCNANAHDPYMCDSCDPFLGCVAEPVEDGGVCSEGLCDEDQYVTSGSCAVCPAGTTNEEGDDPSGGDTSCDVIECAGFEPPMDIYPVRVKKNRALPLKAELFDADGFPMTDADLTAPPIVQVWFNSVGDGDDVTDEVSSVGQGDEGNQFVFTGGGRWQFNLSTKNYTSPGKYTVLMQSGDESEYVIEPTCMTEFVIPD
jgi:hypothetical protein